MNEQHTFDGKRYHESASYEGTVYACLCGERFVGRSECFEHIRKAGETDLLQIRLRAAYSTYLTHSGSLVGSRYEEQREAEAQGGW